MKLVLFDDAKTGLLRDGRVVDLSPVLGSLAEQPAQWRMEAVIEAFDEYRPQFEQLWQRASRAYPAIPCRSLRRCRGRATCSAHSRTTSNGRARRDATSISSTRARRASSARERR